MTNSELVATLRTILARVDASVYRDITEVNFPIVATQTNVIRRMQRTLADIANDIHAVLDRE